MKILTTDMIKIALNSINTFNLAKDLIFYILVSWNKVMPYKSQEDCVEVMKLRRLGEKLYK